MQAYQSTELKNGTQSIDPENYPTPSTKAVEVNPQVPGLDRCGTYVEAFLRYLAFLVSVVWLKG